MNEHPALRSLPHLRDIAEFDALAELLCESQAGWELLEDLLNFQGTIRELFPSRAESDASSSRSGANASSSQSWTES